MIDGLDREALIEAALRYQYQLDDFPADGVKLQIEGELDEIIELNEDSVLEKRLDYIGIGTKEDYLNRWIDTEEGFVLAGIRHLGGNKDEPFIYMWPSFRVNDYVGLSRELKEHFEIFKPLYVTFWTRPDCNSYAVKIMQQRFIGKISEMVSYDLDLIIPDEYYNWYKEEYERFHEEKPEYVDRVPVNPKDLMDECLKNDLLFLLKDSEDRKGGKESKNIVGLIAGEMEMFIGETAVYLDEILVSADYRGHGYASKLLGSFIRKCEATYLNCYIDSENVTSTKTALRAGEKIFSQECVVRF